MHGDAETFTKIDSPKNKMMRNYLSSFFILAIIFLTGCSGSDTYLGDWKATDINGDKYILAFKPKSFYIKKESGDSLNFEYTQNSVKIENSVKTYGIKLDDGRVYNLFFPVANDVSMCLMTMENGKPVYTLNRTSFMSQDEIYSLVK